MTKRHAFLRLDVRSSRYNNATRESAKIIPRNEKCTNLIARIPEIRLTEGQFRRWNMYLR